MMVGTSDEAWRTRFARLESVGCPFGSASGEAIAQARRKELGTTSTRPRVDGTGPPGHYCGRCNWEFSEPPIPEHQQ